MQKKILLVEPVASYREITALEIEAELGWQVVTQSSFAEVFKLEDGVGDSDILVLGDVCLLEGHCPPEFKKKMLAELKIPVLLFTPYPREELGEYLELLNLNTRSQYLKKPCSMNKLVQTLKEMTDLVELPKPKEYCRVGSEKFFSFNNVNCDVYISLSEDKFIKVINAFDLYDSAILQKYIEKGVSYFYIKTSDYQQFSTSYYRYLRERMYSTTVTVVEKSAIEGEIVQNIRERVLNMGVDKETIQLVDEINESCMSYAKKNAKLFAMLDALMKQNSYMSSHSLMIAYVATAFAKMMGLTSEHTHKKLCYAALLHDLFLDEENAKLADYANSKEEVEGTPTWDKLKKHPHEAFTLVAENLFIPEDVGTMILCHHERPDGKGYPRGLAAAAVPALAALFIVAEDLSVQIQKNGIEYLKSNDLKEYLRKKYSAGSFVKPLEVALKFISAQN